MARLGLKARWKPRSFSCGPVSNLTSRHSLTGLSDDAIRFHQVWRGWINLARGWKYHDQKNSVRAHVAVLLRGCIGRAGNYAARLLPYGRFDEGIVQLRSSCDRTVTLAGRYEQADRRYEPRQILL